MDDVRGFEALIQLVQAWHDDNCTSVACPCSRQVAEDAARVICRQIVDEYEESKW